jgi:hypothetical protein
MTQKTRKTITRVGISALVLTGLIVVSPQPASALFGFGDIVFDPSSWASLGSIWSQDISNGLKLEQEISEATKIYNNAVQVYNLAQQEASYLHHKQMYQAIGAIEMHAAVANVGGETSGWDRALTMAAGLTNATQAWQHATAPGTSMQARVNLADSMGIDALNVIGSCYDAAGQNDGALQRLESFALDNGAGSNVAVAQANAANLAQVQMLRTQQCQHSIANEQLKQKLLQNLRERDIESDQLTFLQATANYNHTEDNAWQGGAGSFSSYRVP